MAGIGHAVVGMAAARWRARDAVQAGLMTRLAAWALLSMMPDIDVIGFSLGVGYDSIWGHRGVTHSLAFAVAVGVVVARVSSVRGLRAPARAGLLAAGVVASHPLLDTLTDGGRGCALFWPFTDERYFAPWHPIPVSPIGLNVFSLAAVHVAARELLLFLPLLLYVVWPRGRFRGPQSARSSASP